MRVSCQIYKVSLLISTQLYNCSLSIQHHCNHWLALMTPSRMVSLHVTAPQLQHTSRLTADLQRNLDERRIITKHIPVPTKHRNDVVEVWMRGAEATWQPVKSSWGLTVLPLPPSTDANHTAHTFSKQPRPEVRKPPLSCTQINSKQSPLLAMAFPTVCGREAERAVKRRRETEEATKWGERQNIGFHENVQNLANCAFFLFNPLLGQLGFCLSFCCNFNEHYCCPTFLL